MVDELYGRIQRAALEKNQWILWAIYTAPPREGDVANGTAVVERPSAPSGEPGTEWATADWADYEQGVAFFSGHYDLTRAEAMADFAVRAELIRGLTMERVQA